MLWKLLIALFDSQLGQVGGEPVTGGEISPGGETAPSGETGSPASGGATAEPESFIDPSQLPDEIKPHWKRMHRAYTKKLEGIADLQKKADQIRRFYDDPEFARDIIGKWVGQFGYQLTPAQQRAAVQAAGSPTSTNPDLVEAIKSQLDPSLHWMAPSLANALMAANQSMFAPQFQQLQQQQQAQVLGQRSAQYDTLANELTSSAPGWEEHENEMAELLDFWTSPDMSHPKFGSKLALLYGIVTGNAAATTEAIRRLSGANRNKSALKGGVPGRSVPDISKQIKEAPNSRAAWEIVKKQAMNE